jgi:hypothetical protein
MGTFWQENYAFIKDVYDTRAAKLAELMQKTNESIADVYAEKVYTSAEFKKVKETFTVGSDQISNLRFSDHMSRHNVRSQKS